MKPSYVGYAGILVLTALLAGCSGIPWQRDYEAGLRTMAQTNRRALLQFYSAVSADCRAMDFEVFSDDDVQRLMQRFTPIRVDTLNRELARQYGVQEPPAFFVIRPDMTVAGSCYGKMDRDKFRVFLIKHAYD